MGEDPQITFQKPDVLCRRFMTRLCVAGEPAKAEKRARCRGVGGGPAARPHTAATSGAALLSRRPPRQKDLLAGAVLILAGVRPGAHGDSTLERRGLTVALLEDILRQEATWHRATLLRPYRAVHNVLGRALPGVGLQAEVRGSCTPSPRRPARAGSHRVAAGETPNAEHDPPGQRRHTA